MIELGVADTCVGHIADDDLAVLDEYAQRLAAIVAEEAPDLAEFLDASHGYHLHFVGLGGSPQLRETYDSARHLDALAAGHRRAGLAERSSTSPTTPRSPGPAATATSRRARQLIVEHTKQVADSSATLIDRAGGAL